MLQHYSRHGKKDWLHSAYWLLLGLAVRSKRECGGKSGIRRTFEQPPLRVDANNHTVTMLVQINGRSSPTTLVTVLCLKMAPTDIIAVYGLCDPESIL